MLICYTTLHSLYWYTLIPQHWRDIPLPPLITTKRESPNQLVWQQQQSSERDWTASHLRWQHCRSLFGERQLEETQAYESVKKWEVSWFRPTTEYLVTSGLQERLVLNMAWYASRAYNEEERVTSVTRVPGGTESLCLNLEWSHRWSACD